MNILPRPAVSVMVSRILASLVVPALLLAGCAARREVWKDVVVSSGTHDPGSAINSDYLVHRGANLEVAYANGCRFYVEAGGRFRGLGHGVRECTVYAEAGSKVERREGVRIVRVRNARQAYADRDKPVVQPLGPGIRRGESSGGALPHQHVHIHDHDDDDDHGHGHRSSRARDVQISGSSYKKK